MFSSSSDSVWFLNLWKYNLSKWYMIVWIPVSYSDIRNIGSSDIVTSNTFSPVVGSEPVLFDLMTVISDGSDERMTMLPDERNHWWWQSSSQAHTYHKKTVSRPSNEYIRCEWWVFLQCHPTWAAMEYSSIRGSLVKWNWRGSSVESDTLRPRAR